MVPQAFYSQLFVHLLGLDNIYYSRTRIRHFLFAAKSSCPFGALN